MEENYTDFVEAYIEGMKDGNHDKLATLTTDLKQEDKGPALVALLEAFEKESDEFKEEQAPLIQELKSTKILIDNREAVLAEANTTEAASEGEAEATDPEAVEPDTCEGEK